MKKLLVIRLGALGDLIHVSPSIPALKASTPYTEVHLLTSPAYETLARMMPEVDRVWVLDKASGWPGWLSLLGKLRHVRFDYAVNLHPSFKTWLLVQLLGIGKQAVYHKEKLRQKGQAQRKLSRRHAIEDFYEPFRKLFKLPEPQKPLIPTLNPPDLLGGLPVRRSGEVWIGIIPGVGGKRSNRAWLPESYGKLMEALLNSMPQARVLLIGGPDEVGLAESIKNSLPESGERVKNHCGRNPIPATAWILGQCNIVVGGDTGPSHLAAAMGVPVVGLYGPTSAARTGPRGQKPIRVLTPPEALSSWPCESITCTSHGDEHLACMQGIELEPVLAACQELLALNSTKPAQ